MGPAGTKIGPVDENNIGPVLGTESGLLGTKTGPH